MGQRTPTGNAGTGETARPAASRRPMKWPAVLWSMVGALAAAAVAVPLLASAPSAAPSAAASARAEVTDALTASMGESTVQLTFSASVSASGMTADLTGTGAADLTTKAASMHVTGTVGGQRESVAMDVVHGTVYLQVPQIAALVPGKSWLSLRPGGSTAFGSTIGGLGTFGDPGALLPFLRKSGAVVTPLGQSTLNGTAVEGYRVTMSAAAVEAAASAAGLPSGLGQGVHQLVVTAYVAGHLLQGLDVAATGEVSVTASLDFHGYGQPVVVQPPAPTTVAPFSQIAGAGALPGTSPAT